MTVRLLIALVLASVAPAAQLEKLLSFAGRDAALYSWTDTANTYVLRDGDRALLFDVGDGSVLDHWRALA